MDQELSAVNIELDMLRMKVYNLENTINIMAYTRAKAEASHTKEIVKLQKHINGGHIVVAFVQQLHLY